MALGWVPDAHDIFLRASRLALLTGLYESLELPSKIKICYLEFRIGYLQFRIAYLEFQIPN